jgi:hypothetical protein
MLKHNIENALACRLAYQRSSTSASLAAGRDALRLQSRVQLLKEDYQGQYLIGELCGSCCSALSASGPAPHL